MSKKEIFDEDKDHLDIINSFREIIGSELGDNLTNNDCLRFLRARGGSIEEAKKMLIACEEWRHTLLSPIAPQNLQYSPNTILSMPDNLYDNPHNHFLEVCHHGYDKGGHPIYWEKTGTIQYKWTKIKKVFTIDELVQYHIQSQEASKIRMQYASKLFNKEIEKCTTVFDMKNVTMTLDIGSIMYMKKILSIDQNYYPERLNSLFIINCPWYLTGLYAIFKPCIDTRTSDKFKFFGYDYIDELTKYIDKEVIPTIFGGDCVNVNWCGPFHYDSGVSPEQLKEFRSNTYANGSINKKLTEEEIKALQLSLNAKTILAPIHTLDYYSSSTPQYIIPSNNRTTTPQQTVGQETVNDDQYIPNIRNTATSTSTSNTNQVITNDFAISEAMKIKIIDTQNHKTHHSYIIEVTYKDLPSWQVNKRYSDFVILRQQLMKYEECKNLKSLPRKRLFSNNMLKVVASRKKELEVFLLFAINKFYKIEGNKDNALLKFLDPIGARIPNYGWNILITPDLTPIVDDNALSSNRVEEITHVITATSIPPSSEKSIKINAKTKINDLVVKKENPNMIVGFIVVWIMFEMKAIFGL